MTEPATPRSLGPTIVRYHSPYCEATGPIVEEGTVAARIQALQKISRDHLEITQSHIPVTPTPPCGLITEWKLRSALISRSPDQRDSPESHTQLADYVLSESPQQPEGIVPGIVRNKSLVFDASALRQKSIVVLDYRSKPHVKIKSPESSELPAAQTPPIALPHNLSRETSWKQTIKQNAAVRSGKSIGDKTGSSASTPSTYTNNNGIQDEIWLNRRSTLRKVSSDHTVNAAKPVRQHMNIADQIGEMIDRALQGRDDTSGFMTPQSSVPEFSGSTGEPRAGKLNHVDLARFTKQHTETPAGISPLLQQTEEAQECFTSHVLDHDPVVTDTQSHQSRRYDGSHSFTNSHHSLTDGLDTEKYFTIHPGIEQSETPTHHPRPRACTFTDGRSFPCDEKRVPKPVTRRSFSSPMTSSQERLFCSDDRNDVFVSEMHEHNSKWSQQKHSTVPKDRTCRPDMRPYAATAPRSPPHHSYNQSQGQGSSHKRWKWWKLVMIDKDPFKSGQSDTKPGPIENTTWGSATHPLASYGRHDEGYETSHLVERLERACAEQEQVEQEPPPARPHSVRDMKSSARTTHTLAQCGHEDDEDLEPLHLSGDGSRDVFRSTSTSASGTITHCSATIPQIQVRIISKGQGTRVEVKTGKSQGEDRDRTTKSMRGMRVSVTVEESNSSLVRVEICPKRK